MAKRIGPFQTVERRNQFEVRRGGAVLSSHDTFLNAEDAALRIWLGPRDIEDFDYADISERGADSAH